ncbi:MAG: Acetyltransferase [candidate division TM6 bacterium GW2011_GWE2_41_16]|nr:MAG: Acetyltransferase [candidate division TM6 bacterium GW2011_GWE2_41_16]
MSDILNIREAQKSDALGLLVLMDQWGYPQTSESMKKLLDAYASGDKHVFVAEKDGHMVGLIAIVMYDMFFRVGAKRCRIEGLVTHTEFRRQGIGKALIQKAESVAKKHGCSVIDLTSGARRSQEGTHVFYRALGYANDGDRAKVYVHKYL